MTIDSTVFQLAQQIWDYLLTARRGSTAGSQYLWPRGGFPPAHQRQRQRCCP